MLRSNRERSKATRGRKAVRRQHCKTRAVVKTRAADGVHRNTLAFPTLSDTHTRVRINNEVPAAVEATAAGARLIVSSHHVGLRALWLSVQPCGPGGGG